MFKLKPKTVFLLKYIYKYKYHYLLGIFFILLTNYALASIPLYIKKIIDFIEQGIAPSESIFLKTLVLAILVALSVVIIRTLSRVFFFNTARKIEFEIKNSLFKKLTRLPRSFFIQNPAGKIISQANNDTLWIRLLCGFGIMQAVNTLSVFSIIPYEMWKISPSITVYSLIFLLIFFSGINWGVIYSMRFYLKRMHNLQDLSSNLLASLNGLEIIRSCNVQEWTKQQFQKKNYSLYNNSIKAARIRSVFSPFLNNSEIFLKALIFFIGGSLFFRQEISIGEITAMLSYTAFLTPPLIGLGWLLNVVLQSRLGLKSVYSIFAEKNAYSQYKNQNLTNIKQQMQKGIFIKKLSFCYQDDPKKTILNKINFSIKKGQIVGVLGSIGSGKTTLARCLNKYLSVTRGSVFFGDIDLVDLDYRILRQLVRTVNQDAFLFSDTVANNILFGAKEETQLSESQWEQLFKKSALDSEVAIFPQGKKTIVGEKGVMLSGGQKQRISFARSMMENCELLILDNIMSALDYETEDVLLNQIAKKEYANSILIISHRVRALARADLILVLDQGKIVEKGSLKELLAKKGYFYKTWQIQNEQSKKS